MLESYKKSSCVSVHLCVWHVAHTCVCMHTCCPVCNSVGWNISKCCALPQDRRFRKHSGMKLWCLFYILYNTWKYLTVITSVDSIGKLAANVSPPEARMKTHAIRSGKLTRSTVVEVKGEYIHVWPSNVPHPWLRMEGPWCDQDLGQRAALNGQLV